MNVGDELVGAIAAMGVMKVERGTVPFEKTVHIKKLRIPPSEALAPVLFLDFDNVPKGFGLLGG